ncbi:MAG: methionine--tRNA ligase [Candidatus Peribacteria bacterium]|jgi:methionyl-tRNA synthetase|nr:methionine--tRNA ligase [Candidatus Peribacteria bacterium]
MTKKFFITTPIYYANGLPHIGHANSSFIADFYARWKRLLGYEVKFSTGLDENGQKMVEKAESEGKKVKERLDYVAEKSLKTRKELQISYTDFIRTTDTDHHQFVQSVLQKIYKKGNDEVHNEQNAIYLGEYQGLYCVGCEAFKHPRDLTPEGLCPDHLTKPEIIAEKNWFFNLKNYAFVFEQLRKDNPRFVEPEHRFNEVKAFVQSGLENFSISRENKHTGIGIPLPRDAEQITYVWFDALLNYITVCYRNGENGKFRSKDTEILHILGKDIVKFHATYRPAMLEAAGFRQPDKEFVTGYLTVDGQKMSKSLGNVLDPVEIAREYDRDALVFYLLYDVAIGLDGDFSWDRFRGTREKMLIGGRGNLVNRVANLGKKYGVKQGKFDEKRFSDFVGERRDETSLV